MDLPQPHQSQYAMSPGRKRVGAAEDEAEKPAYDTVHFVPCQEHRRQRALEDEAAR